MIIRTELAGNNYVKPLLIQGEVVEGFARTYAQPEESIGLARNVPTLRVRFTLPEEQREELRNRGMEIYLDLKEGKRLVASYAEVSASDCEILDASFEELNEFKAKNYETKNLRELWTDREIADIIEPCINNGYIHHQGHGKSEA